MYIVEISPEAIRFSNGSTITYDHYPDCCECNYADFEQLDDLARAYEFKGNLQFEAVSGAGFRFGDSRRLFFVPCYSEQNGWYSSEVSIFLDNELVLSFEAEEVYTY